MARRTSSNEQNIYGENLSDNEEPSSNSDEIRRLSNTISNDHNAERRMNAVDPTTTTSQPNFEGDNLLGQAYEESAQRVFKRPNSRITWDHMKYIQEIPRIGIQRIYEKRGDRSRPNAWRRYGALMKLHEIGGWASKIGIS
ncbi:unnamed protein product [Anisakis simplex]|uniref:Uncharacterized protein n=1 Tax=Anisakis simplex TaxID=6269 RepID=A0A0M3J391_ANISI|nr:unnamed protein product [Anisakis simplex]